MKPWHIRLILTHIPLAALIFSVVALPNERPTVRGYVPMLVGLAAIELIFLLSIYRQKKAGRLGKGPFDIVSFVWILLLSWELWASVLNKAHPVLIPAPENVFDTFRAQYRVIFVNIAYSLELLAIGFTLGMALAIFLGLLAGWVPRLNDFFYPIANVMAPIPPIVISPYLVALMPSFRSASVLVIILGVFWPTFLNTINRVRNMEPEIRDSARMLEPGLATMVGKILLPYVWPGVIQGLKVSVTTSMLMLNFAELMGATHGMGYYVQNSIAYANYTHAVAGIIVIGIVVTALSGAVSYIQKVAVPWR